MNYHKFFLLPNHSTTWLTYKLTLLNLSFVPITLLLNILLLCITNTYYLYTHLTFPSNFLNAGLHSTTNPQNNHNLLLRNHYTLFKLQKLNALLIHMPDILLILLLYQLLNTDFIILYSANKPANRYFHTILNLLSTRLS